MVFSEEPRIFLLYIIIAVLVRTAAFNMGLLTPPGQTQHNFCPWIDRVFVSMNYVMEEH